jgi:hypothetical protein
MDATPPEFEAKSRPEQAHTITMSRGDRSSLTALYTVAELFAVKDRWTRQQLGR